MEWMTPTIVKKTNKKPQKNPHKEPSVSCAKRLVGISFLFFFYYFSHVGQTLRHIVQVTGKENFKKQFLQVSHFVKDDTSFSICCYELHTWHQISFCSGYYWAIIHPSPWVRVDKGASCYNPVKWSDLILQGCEVWQKMIIGWDCVH